jgi:hypothetical protein
MIFLPFANSVKSRARSRGNCTHRPAMVATQIGAWLNVGQWA